MSDIVPSLQNEVRYSSVDLFKELVTTTLLTLQSDASKRVYNQTYRKWLDWCINLNIDPLAYTPANVTAFLASADTTKTTRQRQLSSMRKLAQMGYILSPQDDEARRLYEALKMIKPPTPTDQSHCEHQRTVLSADQADKLLRAWEGKTDKERRNCALIAVLLLSGIRRSEAASLRWSDVDFEHGVLHIRHGKGGKARDVPLAGEFALDALRLWWAQQPEGREYIFCAIERGGGIGKHDRPLSGGDIYHIVNKQTAKRVLERYGMVIDWKPHDARRTLITEALATGTPIQTVQAIAGHARGDTTLQYAKSVDARQARKALKLRYG